tara:strand:- start:248 stop:442 length:195 start_codon:yes stop_codon:yes gene_type:complete
MARRGVKSLQEELEEYQEYPVKDLHDRTQHEILEKLYWQLVYTRQVLTGMGMVVIVVLILLMLK